MQKYLKPMTIQYLLTALCIKLLYKINNSVD